MTAPVSVTMNIGAVTVVTECTLSVPRRRAFAASRFDSADQVGVAAILTQRPTASKGNDRPRPRLRIVPLPARELIQSTLRVSEQRVGIDEPLTFGSCNQMPFWARRTDSIGKSRGFAVR
jgi:hypothetical protein